MDFDWQDRAYCKDAEDEDWFTRSRKTAERLRRKFCDKCDVRKECKEYALDLKMEYGVWGGDLIRDAKKEMEDA